jgi:signal transduction histidine kinase
LISRERDVLEVKVLNKGRDSAGNEAAGFGLIGMGERIALYGGELEHGRCDDGWYRLRARFPLSAGEQ